MTRFKTRIVNTKGTTPRIIVAIPLYAVAAVCSHVGGAAYKLGHHVVGAREERYIEE